MRKGRKQENGAGVTVTSFDPGACDDVARATTPANVIAPVIVHIVNCCPIEWPLIDWRRVPVLIIIIIITIISFFLLFITLFLSFR